MSADEDHLGLLDLVRPPRLLGGRELDLVVHTLEDRVRVSVRVRVKG